VRRDSRAIALRFDGTHFGLSVRRRDWTRVAVCGRGGGGKGDVNVSSSSDGATQIFKFLAGNR